MWEVLPIIAVDYLLCPFLTLCLEHFTLKKQVQLLYENVNPHKQMENKSRFWQFVLKQELEIIHPTESPLFGLNNSVFSYQNWIIYQC